MMTLSQQQNKIAAFYRTHRRMPSYSEIAVLMRYKSKNAAYHLAKRLIAAGALARDTAGKLLPARLYGGTRILGLVEAGFPSPAEEELADTMSFDDYLIENKEATYILKVKGDSMIDAGICEGDMVIVERTDNPKVGSIVIAEVDGAWTMKYLRKRGETLYLEPANKAYKPIVPKDELRITAVVKAVVRKY